MAEPHEGIVEQYAEHLMRRAASAVLTFSVAGTIAGAVLGAVPRLVAHSLITHNAGYFAVFLGAVAGGFVGRSLGERRAIGLRLQASLARHQLLLESRPAPAPSAIAPAVAPVAVAPPPVAPSPVALAPPPAVQPPLVAPVPVVAPVLAEPPLVSPAPPAAAVAPLLRAEPAAPLPPVTTPPVSS